MVFLVFSSPGSLTFSQVELSRYELVLHYRPQVRFLVGFHRAASSGLSCLSYTSMIFQPTSRAMLPSSYSQTMLNCSATLVQRLANLTVGKGPQILCT